METLIVTYYNYLGQAMPESANGPGVYGTSAGGETLTAPAGPSSVDGNGGGDRLVGSSGDNTFYVRDPHDVVDVSAGTGGTKTVVAYTSFTLPANVQNLTSSGTYNYAAGNGLDNLIKVGNDGETLYGAGGNDVLVGGFANDTFVVKAGEGSDVIYGFHAGDTIRLVSPSLTSFQAVQSAMSQVGSDVSIRISTGEQLIIRNTTVGQFKASDFLLPLNRSQLGASTLDDEFNSFQPYNFSTHQGLWRTDFGLGRDNPDTYTLRNNGEQQAYVTADYQGSSGHALGYNPFSDSNGVLTITAQPFKASDLQSTFGATYASGMINTRGIFQQQYGYFEIRAELPTAHGAWPAFWMVPDKNTQGVEADITENIAINPNIDFVRAYGGGSASFANVLKTGDISGFHTYGMLWTPSTVTFYYDDQAVFQAPTPAAWNQPMYLIANFAVGGFGGTPDASAFPDTFKIDYIRAYGLADGSSVVEHLTPTAQDTLPGGGSSDATAGDDNLQAGSGATEIHAGAGNDTIAGWSGGDYLTGDDGNDVINGGSGFDRTNGNAGNDTIHGAAGDDWVSGGKNDDVLYGDDGQDIVNGNLGNDTVGGGIGEDTVRGGQGDDVVNGGAGNDWLSGDLGNDTMSGGAGADTFRAFAGGGNDRITDFTASEGDRIAVDHGSAYTVGQVGSDTVITFSGGGEVVLAGVQMSSLPQGWIFTT
ncbi:family 16 glycosylhydrolase [Phenylobacterium soli]|uniref:1,3-beta-glucanase n=1 Tax=Phenylobacterium soli TaxID=2170551 RepID=A0A328ALM7_9CAUL|nr:family 16 glycosylhydrolase [Phenylobacterium soli]RAK55832.1 1,3-beta-glucanase [Phenylobacterium soli]